MTGEENTSADGTSAEAARPVLRIVKGNPTPEELAALTVVLAAASQGGGAEEEPQQTVGGWNDPAAHVRPALRPGPGAWRTSTR